MIKRISIQEVMNFYYENSEDMDFHKIYDEKNLHMEMWFGYFVNENIVAICAIDFNPTINSAFLSNGYVVPEYRNRGIYTQLINYRVNLLKPFGVDIIVFAKPMAQKNVEKCGFVLPEERKYIIKADKNLISADCIDYKIES